MLIKNYIAFSGGVESTSMCVLFGKKADAIFADTGFDTEEVYAQIDKVEKFVQKFHRETFKVHRLSNGSLLEYIRIKKFYPSFKARYCTSKFKIEPIDNFLKQFANPEDKQEKTVSLYIGLNADETGRAGNHARLNHVSYEYPLMTNGITREMCKLIIKKAGLTPKFPVYMRRGGCIGCFYKSRKEFEAMCRINPDLFDVLIDLEEDIQDKREKFYAISTAVPEGMRKFKEHIQKTPLLFSLDEVFAVENDAKSCGVYCNR